MKMSRFIRLASPHGSSTWLGLGLGLALTLALTLTLTWEEVLAQRLADDRLGRIVRLPTGVAHPLRLLGRRLGFGVGVGGGLGFG